MVFQIYPFHNMTMFEEKYVIKQNESELANIDFQIVPLYFIVLSITKIA